MRRYINKSIIWALTIAAMVGCQKENNEIGSSSDAAVEFSTSSIVTRTAEDADDASMTLWSAGDEIAISAPELGYSHLSYKAASDGESTTFTAATSEHILMSVDYSGTVNYSAYYPASAYNSTEEYYTMDVSDQSDYMTLDLLYAQTAETYTGNNSNPEVAFTFDHALSKIVFNITYNNESEAESYSATISDVVTEASYEVVDGKMTYDATITSGKAIAMYMSSGSAAKAVVHPVSYGGKMVTFTYDGTEYYAPYPDDDALVAGKVYTHEVIVGENEVEFTGETTITDWLEETNDGSDLEINTSYTWDGSVAKGFEPAAGTTDPIAYSDDIDTYYIKTGAQLAYLASLVNGGTYMSGKTFILMNDIDLNNEEWTPIGSTSTKSFKGTFDGNEYAITGLSVSSTNNSGYLGLFGYTSSTATIKDLAVTGSVTSSSTYSIAGISGINNGLIENCSFSGSIESTADINIGGITAVNYGTIKYCSNHANLNGLKYVGGIAATISTSSTSTSRSSITSCYNDGSIERESSTTTSYIGGIVAVNVSSLISSCYNKGEIIINQDNTTGGGIVGQTQANTVSGAYTATEVISCYNIGTITINDTGVGAGVIGSHADGEAWYVFCKYVEGLNLFEGYGGTYAMYSTFTYDEETGTLGDISGFPVDYLIDGLDAGAPGTWEEDLEGINGGCPILTGFNYNNISY